MTRIPHCKGSFYKRKGKSTVQVRIPLGWNEQEKKYDTYYEEVSDEAEAIVCLKEVNEYLYFEGEKDKLKIANHRNKKLILRQEKKKSLTFNEMAKEFIEIRESQQNFTKRTIATYKELQARLNPYIGEILLKDLMPITIDRMYSQMRSDGRKNLSGKPYTGTTLERTHNFLKLVLDKAVDYGYIEENPALKVDRPKRDTKEKRALSVDDAQNLYIYLTERELTAHSIGLLIGLLTGVRLSEMLALTWDCFDGENLNIYKSLEKDSQETKSTKTGESRIVSCPPALIEQLKVWKAEQKKYYKKIGLIWTKKVPIVNSLTGTALLQSTYRRWLASQMPNFPISEPFTFHQLRHTYITFLYRDCGVDAKTTRSLSGHKSVKAFSGYTHTNEEFKKSASNMLSEIIAPKPIDQTCFNCSLWSKSPVDQENGVCWKTRNPKQTKADNSCEFFTVS